MVVEDITLESVQQARQRVQPYIRQTPFLQCHHQHYPLPNSSNITFKLECLQVTGSFKVRGALNKLFSLPEEKQQHPLFAASGGNHGLAVAYAGYIKKLPTTIYLPESTDRRKVEKIKNWGAKVALAGHDIKEAIEIAQVAARSEKAIYIHPFADPDVIRGQGTLGLDIMEALPDLDVLIVAMGGGGLIGGVGSIAKILNPSIKIIGVEPETYPTLTESLRAGRVVTLERRPTVAVTLAVLETSLLNLALAQKVVDQTILVTEEEIIQGAQWLWREFSVAAEYSGAAALSALVARKVTIQPNQKACVIICGAGSDGISL